MKLTLGKLLQSLDPGSKYRASELTEWFDTSTAQMNDMLCTLVEDGLIRMSSHATRIIRFGRLAFQPARSMLRSRNATADVYRDASGYTHDARCPAYLRGVAKNPARTSPVGARATNTEPRRCSMSSANGKTARPASP